MTTNPDTTAPEQPQMPEVDPHIDAAAAQEQELLNAAMQRAQAEHLFNRVVTLSAEVARLREQLAKAERGPRTGSSKRSSGRRTPAKPTVEND